MNKFGQAVTFYAALTLGGFFLLAKSVASDPPKMPAPSASTANVVWLEKFDGKLVWTEGNSVEGKSDYFLKTESGNSYLRAEYIPGTKGRPIYRKMKWNTQTHPWFSWRWRVNKFPEGAVITEDKKSDAAAQIYVGWDITGRGWTLKYFWSIIDPVGTTFDRGRWNPLGKYFAMVIRREGPPGVWQTEVRNIREEFKKAFGRDAPVMASGIGLLTDGDQTKTQPAADYDNFAALTSSEIPR